MIESTYPPSTRTAAPVVAAATEAVKAPVDAVAMQAFTDATAQLSKALSGLIAGVAYYWPVNASNGSQTSAWSGAWKFSTMPGAPTAPASRW